MSDIRSQTNEYILDIQKSILRKKIMMNIIVENYSFFDSVFKWISMLIALTSPAISMIDRIINRNNDSTGSATIVLSSIVVGLFKLKDFLKFDKIQDLAKSQSWKYDQLFKKIVREKITLSDSTMKDYVYWINREYNGIELNDPELTFKEKQKFQELCISKGIPTDDDLTKLDMLIHGKNTIQIKEVDKIMDNTKTEFRIKDNILEQKTPQSTNTIQELTNEIQDVAERVLSTDLQNTSHYLTHDVQNIPQYSEVQNIPQYSEVQNIPQYNDVQNNKISNSPRFPSSPDNREITKSNYKKTLKNLNTKTDIDWALDRLSDLSDSKKLY
jgi:hypothetical protein